MIYFIGKNLKAKNLLKIEHFFKYLSNNNLFKLGMLTMNTS